MINFKIGDEIRMDLPVNGSILKSLYVKGIITDFISEDEVELEVGGMNKRWTLTRINEFYPYKISEIKKIIYDPIRFVNCESVKFKCPIVHLRLPRILVYEQYWFKCRSWKEDSRIEMKKEIGYYGCGTTTGYNFESSGMFGFLQDDFDKMMNGEKIENIYYTGRWRKPNYKTIMYFTDDTIKRFNELEKINVVSSNPELIKL
jgi:hypothetical protein